MFTPIVSVVIPNHNYGEFISTAIESVFHQSIKEIEVFVVDNGSTDNSIEILETYKKNHRFRLILQEDRGQANARNVGLSESQGKYIAFLDADDWWEPSKIEKQLRKISGQTSLVYCGINLHYCSKGDKFFTKVEIPKFSGDVLKNFYVNPGESIVLAGESTVLMTKALQSEVGLFDESLNSSTGSDFFRRCAERSQIDFVGEPLVNYRIHDRNLSRNILGNISDIRRAYYLAVKTSNDQIRWSRKMYGFIKLKWRLIKTLIKYKKIVYAGMEIFKVK